MSTNNLNGEPLVEALPLKAQTRQECPLIHPLCTSIMYIVLEILAKANTEQKEMRYKH